MFLREDDEGRCVAPHLEMNTRDLSIVRGRSPRPLWPTPGMHVLTLFVFGG